MYQRVCVHHGLEEELGIVYWGETDRWNSNLQIHKNVQIIS